MMSAKEDVVNHLMFHKALIENDESGQRFDQYIKMAEAAVTDMELRMTNQYDQAIAQTFQLAITEQFDPWDIDLRSFSRMYLKRIRKSKDFDLITAGRLVFMAWSVLKIQSDDLLIRSEPVRDEQNNVVDVFWYPDYMDEPFDMEGDRLYNDVMGMEVAPLEKSLTRNQPRTVTLMELVDAFDEARREAELQLKINEIREKNRANRKPLQVGKNVHKEELAEDIMCTWNAICGQENTEMTLTELGNCCEQDLITMFLSLLFLARDKKVKLWQKDFPNGDILIKKMSEMEAGQIEIMTAAGEKQKVNVEDLVTA
jgi:segregation and condensation protein A